MRSKFVKVLTVGLAIGSLVWTAGCGSSVPGLPSGSGGSNTGPDLVVSDTGCEPVASPSRAIREEMYDALNRYRLQNERSALAYSGTLEAAADAHARDMYQRGFFDHDNPDGDGPLERVQAAGFCELSWVGENIAMGPTSVTEVQNAWANSPEHDYVMLHEQYTFVGMGYYISPGGTRYWVQDFGRSGFSP